MLGNTGFAIFAGMYGLEHGAGSFGVIMFNAAPIKMCRSMLASCYAKTIAL